MPVWSEDYLDYPSHLDGANNGRNLIACEHMLESDSMDGCSYNSSIPNFDCYSEGKAAGSKFTSNADGVGKSWQGTSELWSSGRIWKWPKSCRGDNYGVPHGTPPSKSSYNGSSAFFRELLMHQDSWERDRKSIDSLLNVLSSTSPDCFISPNMEMNRALAQHREVALKRSLFSLVLSFMVGMTIWEAGDLCVPLVMALFAVVGMSLVSGVQLFSTIKNKPASDAVALLSLNWFILGVLSYPTLPRFTRILVTTIVSMLDRTIRWLGASSQ
ncbi:hypothetical protein NL676_011006 [Syzygium grande]|nr:hypothetical protein NL676_011006 [Syzygium grande]